VRVAVWHNLSSGGAKRVLYNQIRTLIADGHHVEAWCPPSADQTFLPLSELITEHVVAIDRAGRNVERLSWRELAADRRLDIRAMDEHCRRCAVEIESLGFDLLLAHPCRFYRTTAIGRMTRLPSILVAEPYRPLYEAAPENRWAAPDRGARWWTSPRGICAAVDDTLTARSRRMQVREEITNARGFDRLLSYSAYTRESIRRSYGLDAAICYPGIDTEAFQPTGSAREPFVMSVGAICPDKNLHFVIEALALLRAPRPRLVWVGDQVEDDYLDEVAVLANALGVTLDIRIMIAHSELVALLGSAALMVYAPRLEPLGLAPLEAGACGLPVVAVAEAGIRETVLPGVTGLLTLPQVDAFATAVAELLDDAVRRAAMGAAARDHVAAYWSMASATARLNAHLVEVSSLSPGRPVGGEPSLHGRVVASHDVRGEVLPLEQIQ
jgi:glycosyltransferase involved in cell wall biosynthesis